MELTSVVVNSISVITWTMILFTWLIQWRTWHTYKRSEATHTRIHELQNNMLDQYLAVAMKVAEAPARKSEVDPRLWSVDIEPELLAWIQEIDRSARDRGALLVAVPKDSLA